MVAGRVYDVIAKYLKTKPIKIPDGVTAVPGIAEYTDPFSFDVQPLKGFEPSVVFYFENGETHIEVVWDVDRIKKIGTVKGVIPVYYSYGGRGGITIVKSPENIDLTKPKIECTGLEDVINVIGTVQYGNYYCIDLGEGTEKKGYTVALHPDGFYIHYPTRGETIYERIYTTAGVTNCGIKVWETKHEFGIFGRFVNEETKLEKKMRGLVYAVLGRILMFGYNVEPMIIHGK